MCDGQMPWPCLTEGWLPVRSVSLTRLRERSVRFLLNKSSSKEVAQVTFKHSSGEERLARRKIRKKDLKQPDEFITLSAKIISWCRYNTKILLGTLTCLGLILVVVGSILFIKVNREAKARALYEEALALYPSESSGKSDGAQYAPAIAKLEEVQKRYGSTNVATIALVDLGNCYFESGAYDRSISCYQDFLKRSDRRYALFGQVLESLGETYEASGLWNEALEAYKRLAQEGSPVYQNQAQMYLGRVYEAIGDQKKALSHYENYLRENPVAFYGELIRTKVMRWQLAESSKEEG